MAGASVGSGAWLRSRRAVLAWIGLASSLAFGYLAARGVDAPKVWDALTGSDYGWLAPALLALGLTVYIRALRWRYVFEPASRPPTGPVLASLLVGYFFNNILPVRAGEVVRVVTLHRWAGTSRAEAAGTVVVERVLDVMSLLVLLFVTAPFLPDISWIARAEALAAVLVVGLIVSFFVLARYGDRPARAVLRPLARFSRISLETTERAGRNLTLGFVAMRDVRLAAIAFVLTMLSWLALAMSAWLLFFAFDLDLGYEAAILVVITTNLAQVIPSSAAAVGVFEAAVQVALGPFDVDQNVGLSYALLFHALNVLPFLIVGYLVLHRKTARGLRSPLAAQPGVEEDG